MGNGTSVSNTLTNELTSSITQTATQTVKGNLTVTCQNVQEVVGATGCDITFGPQVCEASGLANVSTDADFSARATQDVYNSVDQVAKLKLEGAVGDASRTSNIANNTLQVATTMVQAFTTDCSKNASAVNEQMVKDCTNSKIVFAAQNSTVRAAGDCSAKATARADAFQKLTNVVKQTAEAEIKGPNLFGFLGIFIIGILLLLIAPRLLASAVGSLASAKAKDPGEQQRRAAQAETIKVLAGLLIAYAAFVWPGLLAAVLQIKPYVADLESDALCTDGKATGAAGEKFNIAPDQIVNDFAFWDPQCILTRPGDECTQGVHYKTCGVFSGRCDDPVLAQDLVRFENVSRACGKMAGLVWQ